MTELAHELSKIHGKVFREGSDCRHQWGVSSDSILHFSAGYRFMVHGRQNGEMLHHTHIAEPFLQIGQSHPVDFLYDSDNVIQGPLVNSELEVLISDRVLRNDQTWALLHMNLVAEMSQLALLGRFGGSSVIQTLKHKKEIDDGTKMRREAKTIHPSGSLEVLLRRLKQLLKGLCQLPVSSGHIARELLLSWGNKTFHAQNSKLCALRGSVQFSHANQEVGHSTEHQPVLQLQTVDFHGSCPRGVMFKVRSLCQFMNVADNSTETRHQG